MHRPRFSAYTVICDGEGVIEGIHTPTPCRFDVQNELRRLVSLKYGEVGATTAQGQSFRYDTGLTWSSWLMPSVLAIPDLVLSHPEEGFLGPLIVLDNYATCR